MPSELVLVLLQVQVQAQVLLLLVQVLLMMAVSYEPRQTHSALPSALQAVGLCLLCLQLLQLTSLVGAGSCIEAPIGHVLKGHPALFLKKRACRPFG